MVKNNPARKTTLEKRLSIVEHCIDFVNQGASAEALIINGAATSIRKRKILMKFLRRKSNNYMENIPIWDTDVTEFKYGTGTDERDGKVYLSVILDLCDHKPVSYVLGRHNDNDMFKVIYNNAICIPTIGTRLYTIPLMRRWLQTQEHSQFFTVTGGINIRQKYFVKRYWMPEQHRICPVLPTVQITVQWKASGES